MKSSLGVLLVLLACACGHFYPRRRFPPYGHPMRRGHLRHLFFPNSAIPLPVLMRRLGLFPHQRQIYQTARATKPQTPGQQPASPQPIIHTHVNVIANPTSGQGSGISMKAGLKYQNGRFGGLAVAEPTVGRNLVHPMSIRDPGLLTLGAGGGGAGIAPGMAGYGGMSGGGRPNIATGIAGNRGVGIGHAIAGGRRNAIASGIAGHDGVGIGHALSGIGGNLMVSAGNGMPGYGRQGYGPGQGMAGNGGRGGLGQSLASAIRIAVANAIAGSGGGGYGHGGIGGLGPSIVGSITGAVTSGIGANAGYANQGHGMGRGRGRDAIASGISGNHGVGIGHAISKAGRSAIATGTAGHYGVGIGHAIAGIGGGGHGQGVVPERSAISTGIAGRSGVGIGHSIGGTGVNAIASGIAGDSGVGIGHAISGPGQSSFGTGHLGSGIAGLGSSVLGSGVLGSGVLGSGMLGSGVTSGMQPGTAHGGMGPAYNAIDVMPDQGQYDMPNSIGGVGSPIGGSVSGLGSPVSGLGSSVSGARGPGMGSGMGGQSIASGIIREVGMPLGNTMSQAGPGYAGLDQGAAGLGGGYSQGALPMFDNAVLQGGIGGVGLGSTGGPTGGTGGMSNIMDVGATGPIGNSLGGSGVIDTMGGFNQGVNAIATDPLGIGGNSVSMGGPATGAGGISLGPEPMFGQGVGGLGGMVSGMNLESPRRVNAGVGNVQQLGNAQIHPLATGALGGGSVSGGNAIVDPAGLNPNTGHVTDPLGVGPATGPSGNAAIDMVGLGPSVPNSIVDPGFGASAGPISPGMGGPIHAPIGMLEHPAMRVIRNAVDPAGAGQTGVAGGTGSTSMTAADVLGTGAAGPVGVDPAGSMIAGGPGTVDAAGSMGMVDPTGGMTVGGGAGIVDHAGSMTVGGPGTVDAAGSMGMVDPPGGMTVGGGSGIVDPAGSVGFVDPAGSMTVGGTAGSGIVNPAGNVGFVDPAGSMTVGGGAGIVDPAGSMTAGGAAGSEIVDPAGSVGFADPAGSMTAGGAAGSGIVDPAGSVGFADPAGSMTVGGGAGIVDPTGSMTAGGAAGSGIVDPAGSVGFADPAGSMTVGGGTRIVDPTGGMTAADLLGGGVTGPAVADPALGAAGMGNHAGGPAAVDAQNAIMLGNPPAGSSGGGITLSSGGMATIDQTGVPVGTTGPGGPVDPHGANPIDIGVLGTAGGHVDVTNQNTSPIGSTLTDPMGATNSIAGHGGASSLDAMGGGPTSGNPTDMIGGTSNVGMTVDMAGPSPPSVQSNFADPGNAMNTPSGLGGNTVGPLDVGGSGPVNIDPNLAMTNTMDLAGTSPVSPDVHALADPAHVNIDPSLAAMNTIDPAGAGQVAPDVHAQTNQPTGFEAPTAMNTGGGPSGVNPAGPDVHAVADPALTQPPIMLEVQPVQANSPNTVDQMIQGGGAAGGGTPPGTGTIDPVGGAGGNLSPSANMAHILDGLLTRTETAAPAETVSAAGAPAEQGAGGVTGANVSPPAASPMPFGVAMGTGFAGNALDLALADALRHEAAGGGLNEAFYAGSGGLGGNQLALSSPVPRGNAAGFNSLALQSLLNPGTSGNELATIAELENALASLRTRYRYHNNRRDIPATGMSSKWSKGGKQAYIHSALKRQQQQQQQQQQQRGRGMF